MKSEHTIPYIVFSYAVALLLFCFHDEEDGIFIFGGFLFLIIATGLLIAEIRERKRRKNQEKMASLIKKGEKNNGKTASKSVHSAGKMVTAPKTTDSGNKTWDKEMDKKTSECKYYLFSLGNTVVKDDGNGLWYRRNREKHTWVMEGEWLARFYDVQYDVIEIDYDEENEIIKDRKMIKGYWSHEMVKMAQDSHK